MSIPIIFDEDKSKTEIIDTKQLVKILNDTREYFPYSKIQNVDYNTNEKVYGTISCIIDLVCDLAEVDPDYVNKISESVVFNFKEDEKIQFVNDLGNENRTVDVEEKYLEIGKKQLILILDYVIVPSITVKSKVETGLVTLQLNQNITIKEFFRVCYKIMDHPNHSIAEVKYVAKNQIEIVVDEST